MRKNYITIAAALTLIFFLSYCTKKSKENQNDYIISVDIEQKDKISFFDIFSKIDIIPLETTDISLIRLIHKLIIYDDKLYVFDRTQSQVFVFTQEGKFIFTINNKGSGPDQYLIISDFDIYDDTISLVSTMDGTLHKYDLNGNFIKRISLPQIKGAYGLIKHLNKDTIAFWTYDYANKLKFYSTIGKDIFKETMPEKNNIYNSISTPVFPYGNFLVRTMNNKVIELQPGGKLITVYKWDFGKLNNNLSKLPEPPDENKPEKMYEFAKKIYSSEVVNYFFGPAGGNSNYIYTQITRKNKQINIFYKKHDNSKLVFEETTEGAKFYPLFWAEDYVVGHIYEGRGVEEILPDKILNKENIAVKNQLSELDNPVLIKYYFMR